MMIEVGNFETTSQAKPVTHGRAQSTCRHVKTLIWQIHNLNGKACVIRSICEAKTHLAPSGRSLVHDTLRVVFTAPLHEEEFNKEIGLTHNELSEPNFCDRANDCPFSY